MASVILTPIIPSAPSGAVQGVQQGAVTSNAVQVPPSLSVLPTGTILQGFVLNRDSAGNPVLRTANGDFILQSQVFLKIGSEVTIRINNSGQNFRANIVTVDGALLSELEAQTQNTAANTARDTIVRSAAAQVSGATPEEAISPQAAVQARATLKTIFLSAGASTDDIDAPAIPTPKPGAAFGMKLTSATFPHLPAQSAATTAPPLNTDTKAYAAYAKPATSAITPLPAIGTAPVPPVTAKEGAPQQLTQTNNTPSQPQNAPTQVSAERMHLAAAMLSAALPSLSQGGVAQLKAFLAASPSQPTLPLPAVVIGHEQSGEPVLHTPIGVFRIASNLALPVGSKITAELSQLPANAQSVVPMEEAAVSLSTLSGGWTSLQQIVSVLQDLDPKFAALFLQQHVPSITLASPSAASATPLPSGLFFFINALKGGDFKSWLGTRAMEKLEQSGNSALLSKAESEFNLLQLLANDKSPQSWQTYLIPVVVEGQLEMARFFSKRQKKQDASGHDAGDDTRFIVELEVSALGALQLDGFVRHAREKMQFDLIIRSHEQLPPELTQSLISIYNDTGELTGYLGTLQFQTWREFPIHPLEEVQAPPAPDILA